MQLDNNATVRRRTSASSALKNGRFLRRDGAQLVFTTPAGTISRLHRFDFARGAFKLALKFAPGTKIQMSIYAEFGDRPYRGDWLFGALREGAGDRPGNIPNCRDASLDS